MSEELKPCPFCGAPVTVSIKGKLGVIMCPVGTGCVGSGLGNFFNADQQETACAAWNTRAPDARLAAAEAERNAAVASRDAMLDNYGDGLVEGARVATAAIVADLRKAPRFHEIEHDLANRYKAGEHLKGTSNE